MKTLFKASQIVRILPAILLTCMAAQAFAAPASSKADRRHAREAVKVLQQWYTPQSGLYRTTGWWNSANAITALANYSRMSHTKKYLPIFANTLHAAQTGHDGAPGFVNDYYDDEGWWALAWIDVYDLTGKAEYLQAAGSIFDNMQKGWETETCGGGVWWSKKSKEKNAIENELFLDVAASLANRTKAPEERERYLSWAQKEWAWFHDSGMINRDHLINDGLDLSNPAHCTNNGKATWSYNQGVILGALVELNKAAPDPALAETASTIAHAAIEHLTDEQGVLREPNGAHTGGDVPQFKGIFSRNLMLLNNAFPDDRYQAFARANADSIWAKDRDAANHLGFWWAGPFDLADAARQSSALDALTAAGVLGSAQRR
ncbi:MAG TPA: glycoside hydrolase family 76 protein [Edaphobacter sp.]|uniref:glycoside hydrolase family 76 protein n=1 Tax=Edaphobacter sp. TaxID=1934404 RepID=UPI002B87D45B|nr:glycoside hydrolase family 76 protein [Edaphobacter sp.]HUZ96172.1 glycoside hydrolase family 76 protein [Edaphobacter sp.]